MSFRPPFKIPQSPLLIIALLALAGILILALIPITFTVTSAVASLFKAGSTTEAPKTLEALEPISPPGGWPHLGLTGTFDRAALQRGFQVYKQVCSTCHSMRLLSYRNLRDLGFSEAEVKAIAADYQVPADPDDEGNVKMRKARPSDHFVGPFANEQAARAANGGALPPDLSLIVKARHHNEDYVYSIVTGDGQTPPADEKVANGMYFDPYFPGHQIAMPPPLSEGAVTYADGTKATVPQMAQDVVQFLAWASEPKLEARKETGLKAITFLVVMVCILYGVKRRVWSKVH